MSSVGGVTLDNWEETQTKDSQLFQQPIPTSDSDSSILLDLFGMSRTISGSGTKSGTASTLNTFITAIETIAGGSQSGSTFVSGLSTFANKTVFIQSFSWSYLKGKPRTIEYSLELVEGATVA